MNIKRLLPIATLSVLVLFLWYRYRMAMTQHFDIDEYAYLHWASHITLGAVPFRDFFYILLPGFIWVLAPLFLIFPPLTLAPIYGARVLEFSIFVFLAAGVGFLFWQLRKSWIALLPALILVFLPMPSIKFMEIRPDTLAMALTVAAMVCLIGYIKQWKPAIGVGAGALYGLALLVSTKMVPAVAAAGGVLCIAAVLRKNMKIFFPPILGGVLVAGAYLVWVAATGGWHMLDAMWYDVVVASVEDGINLGRLWPIPPDFFFRPNAYFYGVGSDAGRIVNNVLWGFGILIAVWRVFAAIIIRSGTWLQELIVGITFAAFGAFFLWTPLRHAQYLIPLAVWVAWYAADGIYALWILLCRTPVGTMVFAVLFVTGLSYLTHINSFVYKTRWVLPVDNTLDTVKSMWREIPTTEYVFDLEGITLYYPDPHYACCTMFGQIQPYLSRPFPDIAETLERTHTNYVYQGESGRINTLLLKDQAYILKHFEPWQGHPELLVRKK